VKRRLFSFVACLIGLTGLAVSSARADDIADTVTVSMEPKASSVSLGESLDLQITVTNTGPRPSPPLIIHLDITDPDRSTSVDPEDWTATLSKTVGVVAAGDEATVGWSIQPISGGHFAAYAVALSPGVDDVATSNVLQIAVAEQRTLDPGGILAVAIGAPALVGGLLLLQMRIARRPRLA
jgi:uncharacterized membrane protein